MTRAVQILAISDDTDVRNTIRTSLGSDSYKTMCVSSSREALQLLDRGVVADFLLFDAVKNKPDDLFTVDLLQHLSNEKLCILSEIGDRSWENYAAKWSIKTVLTKPLRREDLEKLASGPRSTRLRAQIR
jgi:two-component system response regulator AtoC